MSNTFGVHDALNKADIALKKADILPRQNYLQSTDILKSNCLPLTKEMHSITLYFEKRKEEKDGISIMF